VDSLTGPAGGYRLRGGTAMPPLLLDDEEAIAVAVGLRTAARASVTGIEETAVRALVKLEQVLPTHLRRRVRALGSATISPPVGGPTVDPQHLTVIAAACRDSERLRFAYRSRDGTDSRREVEPHALVNLGRRWYLLAWDRRREDWRSFRVDRLSRPASTGVRFAARRLPAKDAAAFVKESIIAAPSRFEARVTLRAAADEIASRVPARWGMIEPIDAHTCEYRIGDDDLGWLALRVAMLGVDFEVHEPPELLEHWQTGSSAPRCQEPVSRWRHLRAESRHRGLALLRERLSRICFLGVLLEAEDLLVAHGEELEEALLDLEPAPFPASALSHRDEHTIAVGDEVLRLDRELLERLEPVSEGRSYAVVAAEGLCRLDRPNLALRMHFL
jgi:predicted DNA-binding transcriptional regulator YafY